MKTTNSKAYSFINQLKTFRANNLHATDNAGMYIVWSYGWYPLFVYARKNNQWFENETKYSVSTSKQKTQCQFYSANRISIPYETMKRMIEQNIDDHIKERSCPVEVAI